MFRISLLLWLIALAALNLTLLKYSDAVIHLSPKFAGLIGLMPLFDLFALSFYLALTRRYRFALVRRAMRKNIVDSAAMVSGAILVVSMASCLLFPEVVVELMEILISPFHQWIKLSESSPENARLPDRHVAGDGHIRAINPPHVRPRLYPQPLQARDHAARERMTAKPGSPQLDRSPLPV